VRTLELNFASRPFRNNTLLWIGHSVLTGTVVAATAWNTLTFLDTGRRLDELRSRVGSIESRRDRVEALERRLLAEAARYDLKYLRTQTTRANDVIGDEARVTRITPEGLTLEVQTRAELPRQTGARRLLEIRLRKEEER